MRTCSLPLLPARMMKPAVWRMGRKIDHVRLSSVTAQRSTSSSHAEQLPAQEKGAGTTFRVDEGQNKTRLDAFLSAAMSEASRAKLQASIRGGLVTVNGTAPLKPGHPVRPGDIITCRLLPPAPVEAAPEDILLAVVYEDEHLLVIDKPAGMVVHPAPGHASGTLVNALLHRFALPALRLDVDGLAVPASEHEELPDPEVEDGDAEGEGGTALGLPWALPGSLQGHVIRPGIVHRLDKGTTGLLVVAKDDYCLAGLAAQFKAHTVERCYEAIVLGQPKAAEGRVETNIGRDVRDRKRMGVFPWQGSRGRHAVSEYSMLEGLAGGGAAWVQWRLRTGRTHQIRVHARHLGHPLLGDEAYGGSGGSALAAIGHGKAPRQAVVHRLLKELGRPALHAKTLGFEHPRTKERLSFASQLPEDFAGALAALRDL